LPVIAEVARKRLLFEMRRLHVVLESRVRGIGLVAHGADLVLGPVRVLKVNLQHFGLERGIWADRTLLVAHSVLVLGLKQIGHIIGRHL
jgi:hypothetical protein